jgi:hypothetical protein
MLQWGTESGTWTLAVRMPSGQGWAPAQDMLTPPGVDWCLSHTASCQLVRVAATCVKDNRSGAFPSAAVPWCRSRVLMNLGIIQLFCFWLVWVESEGGTQNTFLSLILVVNEIILRKTCSVNVWPFNMAIYAVLYPWLLPRQMSHELGLRNVFLTLTIRNVQSCGVHISKPLHELVDFWTISSQRPKICSFLLFKSATLPPGWVPSHRSGCHQDYSYLPCGSTLLPVQPVSASGTRPFYGIVTTWIFFPKFSTCFSVYFPNNSINLHKQCNVWT